MRKPLLLLACLALAGAAEAAKAPKWTRGADPAYPDAAYLKGVGVGVDLEAARSNARAEIAKVFRARVEQTAVDSASESSAGKGRKRGPAETSQRSELKTKVSTDALLEGVEIAAVWYDKKARQHYALAVLNKPKARADLSLRIAEKEAAVAEGVRRGDAAKGPVEAARAYAGALAAAREREELLPRRRVVDPVGAGRGPGLSDGAAPIPDLDGVSAADVERRLADASGRVLFLVEAEGGARLKETVAGRITALGFRVLASTQTRPALEGPLLAVRCRLSVEPYDRGNPSWKFFRWAGTVELADASAGGKVLASAAPSGTEGHLTEETARLKTVAAGEQGLAREAEAKISEYIFGK
jgi:hypothetical protein